MPWDVRKNGSWWEIYKPGSGKVVGRSTSKGKAEASVRARYAGARARGERLSERTIPMHELERLCVTVVELNELVESGWEVQTLIFNKDKFPAREKALAKAREMGFNSGTSRETGDEDAGSWRVRQAPPGKFSEFRTQIINDNISIVHGKLKAD